MAFGFKLMILFDSVGLAQVDGRRSKGPKCNAKRPDKPEAR